MSSIKTGELKVNIEEEEPIWCDRKRILFFGLPWSFTKYILTPSRLFIQKGFLRRTEEEIRLYRVSDISYMQSLAERIVGCGTVCIQSSDASTPEVHLTHIKKAKTIKNILSQYVEKARQENNVRTSEVVGAGSAHFMGDGHDHPSMGPDVFPDVDHNGVDDRTETE